ncbi:MAG: ArnT family glycosyltransferase [Galactobacter sp.]|uniref:ArnT family glycosyltransferase n=1 Tax=Galactobacter sp. TaxID=2676125 RepID=UPI0025C1B134|nr:glycosyltransferase family 39 protein [Galactobacter sp.]
MSSISTSLAETAGAGTTSRRRLRTRSHAATRAKATVTQRIGLGVLLLGTAVLYLWNLGINGWGNSFYAAAIQAGSENWEAFLFGSSDAGNSITVDKPPAFLWIPALSARIFGLNSWSILVPEALMGVAAVWLLYSLLSRVSNRWVGLLGGTLLAISPVGMLMFRYDNPEALLILLSVAATYGVVRAVQASFPREVPSETGHSGTTVGTAGGHSEAAVAANSTNAAKGGLRSKLASPALWWMVFVGAMVGFGFLTKQLQAVVIVPTLALAYLLCSRAGWLKRIGHLFAAAAAMILAAGWWVALVELLPASARPYVGGSTNNSFLDLTFGYNGLGRLNGDEEGSVGSMWGTPSIVRLVTGNYVTMIGWMIPTALVAAVIGIVLILRSHPKRNDAARLRAAAFVALAGWFVVEGLVISFMQGITHEYYTAILAAPIAGTVALTAGWLWEKKSSWFASISLAALVLVTAGISMLIAANYSVTPVLSVILGAVALVGAVALALRPLYAGERRNLPKSARRTIATAAVAAALIGGLGTQAAFAASTTTTAKTGSLIYAGSSQGRGGPGGGSSSSSGDGIFGTNLFSSLSDSSGRAGGGGQGGPGGMPGGGQGGPGGNGGQGAPGGNAGNGGNGGQQGGLPGGGQGGPGGNTQNGNTQNGNTQGGPGGNTAGNEDGATDGGGGGAGGLLNSSTPGEEVQALLNENADDYTWVAATTGANNAAGYQLAVQHSVMPVGGYNGTDNSPTLEQFKTWVEEGEIHYYIDSGSGRGGSNSDSAASAISSWVQENFTATTVDGVTLYDLTAETSTN